MTTATINTSTAPIAYTTNTITSKDGTRIAYRQLGHGPGLVLVQGTMGTAEHFMELASALSDSFTVYVPDRRGRGDSGDNGDTYSVQKEVEDLDAVLTKTGAHYVFGLSAGAIITLEALLSLPTIHKAIIFEPPLFLDGAPQDAIDSYENFMAKGKTAAAMVVAMKAAKMGPVFFNYIPNWIMIPMIDWSLKQEDKKGPGRYPTMRQLATTPHHDFQLVGTASGKQERYKAIKTEVLLMGGGTSQAYLKAAVRALEPIIPGAKRIEITGVGHGAPWNHDRYGQPEIVAEEIRRFFA
jgi:pimeloyl-ACP methyl ester carboxylesterase